MCSITSRSRAADRWAPLSAVVSAIVAFALCPGLATRASAQEAKLWLPVTVLIEPERSRIRGYFEVQPRFDDDITGAEQLFVRPAIGLALGPEVTALVGYAWAAQFEAPTSYEHRTWQQVSYAPEDAPGGIEARMRLEQRYLPQDGGTSWRIRGRLQAAFDLAEGWKWTVGNEVFVTLNEATMSAPRGFQQNRLDLGVTRELGDHVTLQPRYIAQYERETSGGARHVVNHVLSVGVEIKLR